MSVRTVRDALKILEGDPANGKPVLIKRTPRYRRGQRVADLIVLQLSEVVIFREGPEPDDEDDDEDVTTESAGRPDDAATKSAGKDLVPADSAGAYRQISADLPAKSAGRNLSRESIRENLPPDARAPEGSASPSSEGSPTRPGLDILAARIFDRCTPAHRRKCGEDPRKIEFALRDAERRGYDPVLVTEAMVAMVTSADQAREGGRFAVGPHRAIDDDRWKIWIGRAADRAPTRAAISDVSLASAPTMVTHDGREWLAPAGGQLHPIGTWESPGIKRQLSIMEQWSAPRRLRDWNATKWGPPPGAPGCRLWPSVLGQYPHESSGPDG
jgi:hypothetical protein